MQNQWGENGKVTVETVLTPESERGDTNGTSFVNYVQLGWCCIATMSESCDTIFIILHAKNIS